MGKVFARAPWRQDASSFCSKHKWHCLQHHILMKENVEQLNWYGPHLPALSEKSAISTHAKASLTQSVQAAAGHATTTSANLAGHHARALYHQYLLNKYTASDRHASGGRTYRRWPCRNTLGVQWSMTRRTAIQAAPTAPRSRLWPCPAAWSLAGRSHLHPLPLPAGSMPQDPEEEKQKEH